MVNADVVTSSPDRVDVKTAMTSLGVGKTLFYEKYLADCKIKPTRVGNFSFISHEDFELLRAYHAARGSGKDALANFLQHLEAQLNPTLEIQRYESEPVLVNSLLEIIKQLTHRSESLVQYQELAAKLSARLEVLTHYSNSPDARLMARELAAILEISPRTLHSKREYARYGFRFKCDRQGWQVLKGIAD